VKKVMSGTWGGTGWDLWPRYTQKQQRQRGLALAPDAKRRAELARLARGATRPGPSRTVRRAHRLGRDRTAFRFRARRRVARDAAGG